MHLSDQKLLEMDAHDELHLSQCNECQLRANNIQKIKNKLNQLPSKHLKRESWEKLKYTYQARNHDVKHLKKEKRIKFWKYNTVALAASLTLVIFFLGIPITDRNESSQQQQLTLLVEQNNVLQQQLIKLKQEQITEAINANFFHYQLSVQDQSIQRAHIEQKSITEKSELWRNRQELIKHWLTKKTPSNTISI